MTPTYNPDEVECKRDERNEALTEAGQAGEERFVEPTLGMIVHFTDTRFGGRQAALVSQVVAPSKLDGGIVHLHVFPTRSIGHVEIGVPHRCSLSPVETEKGRKFWEHAR